MDDNNQCRSILITDDNDGVREALISALKAHGFNATGARNGKDAIAKLASLEGPTLIFLDLMMPVMSGWDVLDIWSKDAAFAQNRVVTISAVNLKSRTDARIPKNTVDRLQKPLTFKSVFNLVQKFCGPQARVGASPAAPVVNSAHP